MPINVKHALSLTQAPATNTVLVRPGNWDAEHSVSVNLADNEVIKYISAGTTSISSGVANFSNSPTVNFGMSVDTNGATITGSCVPKIVPFYEFPQGPGLSNMITLAPGTLYLQPFDINANISFCRVVFSQSAAAVVSTLSATWDASNGAWTSSYTSAMTVSTARSVILFSRQATGNGANSSNIVSFGSATAKVELRASLSFSISASATTAVKSCSYSSTVSVVYPGTIDINGNVTYATVPWSGNYSTTAAAASASGTGSVSISTLTNAQIGFRQFDVPFGSALTPGEYWMGIIESSSSTNLNMSAAVSLVGITNAFTALSAANMVPVGQTVSNVSNAIRRGWGSYSASGDYTGAIILTNVSEFIASNVSFAQMKTAFMLRLAPL